MHMWLNLNTICIGLVLIFSGAVTLGGAHDGGSFSIAGFHSHVIELAVGSKQWRRRLFVSMAGRSIKSDVYRPI